MPHKIPETKILFHEKHISQFKNHNLKVKFL